MSCYQDRPKVSSTIYTRKCVSIVYVCLFKYYYFILFILFHSKPFIYITITKCWLLKVSTESRRANTTRVSNGHSPHRFWYRRRHERGTFTRNPKIFLCVGATLNFFDKYVSERSNVCLLTRYRCYVLNPYEIKMYCMYPYEFFVLCIIILIIVTSDLSNVKLIWKK